MIRERGGDSRRVVEGVMVRGEMRLQVVMMEIEYNVN